MVIRLIRLKGRHYDVGNTLTSLDELVEMGGFFPYTEIRDRLPMSERRLRVMIYESDEFRKCFCWLYEDETHKGVLHLDLNRLNEHLKKQMFSSKPISVEDLEKQ